MLITDPHAFLERLAPSTMKFGLERMHAADQALGQPWRAYRSLHVAGTNGKGSTCAFAEAILLAAGCKVGFYSSPHLERVNERIRVDGEDVSDAELAGLCERICAAYAPAGQPGHENSLTYFEFLTAAALLHFRERKVDVAIVEVGLGGRLDASNVITPTASVIATIGFDHTEYLGSTLGLIAREKAGILKPGVPAAVLTREPEALAAIRDQARSVAAGPLFFGGDDFLLERDGSLRLPNRAPLRDVTLSLAGDHQRGNAALAALAATLVQPSVSDEAIRSGLSRARWPGRLERIDGVLLDGAHNREGARALAEELGRYEKPVHLVFGALGDKDVRGMLEALIPRARTLLWTTPRSPRALTPEAFMALAKPLASNGCDVRVCSSASEAIGQAREAAARDGGQVVVAGSLYLIGEARAWLRSRSI